MDSQSRKSHWESIYGSKAETEVSWFQGSAATSLTLLTHESVTPQSAIIDVGGGASRLVDGLLDRGHNNVSVLDISAAALETARTRLGSRATAVRWIVADITQWSPPAVYDVWHDRAVLHFLTAETDRAAYLTCLRQGVCLGGLAVIGSFDLDGPEKCSNLPVQRYSPASLAALLGDGFQPLDSRAETHKTPWGSEQKFQFSSFLRR